jgi:hypothetical protein
MTPLRHRALSKNGHRLTLPPSPLPDREFLFEAPDPMADRRRRHVQLSHRGLETEQASGRFESMQSTRQFQARQKSSHFICNMRNYLLSEAGVADNLTRNGKRSKANLQPGAFDCATPFIAAPRYVNNN